MADQTNMYLCHHGILGQKWGVRRYQNEDGTLTDAGRKHYGLSGKNVPYTGMTTDVRREVSARRNTFSPTISKCTEMAAEYKSLEEAYNNVYQELSNDTKFLEDVKSKIKAKNLDYQDSEGFEIIYDAIDSKIPSALKEKTKSVRKNGEQALEEASVQVSSLVNDLSETYKNVRGIDFSDKYGTGTMKIASSSVKYLITESLWNSGTADSFFKLKEYVNNDTNRYYPSRSLDYLPLEIYDEIFEIED